MVSVDAFQPKIVTCYSFKGGHGRTTTLVNLANLAARTGNKVLCIDLDLEAPGLASRYGLSGLDRGFVGYAIDLLAGKEPSFDPIEIETTPFNGSKKRGSLHILPAGCFSDVPLQAPTDQPKRQKKASFSDLLGDEAQKYWEFMATDAQRIFSTSGTAQAFWNHFRQDIHKVKESSGSGFDYVFVDLRSGFSPLSLAGLEQWPGALALFFSRNPESARGTEMMVNLVTKSAPEHHQLVAVLTRRPSFLSESSQVAEFKEELRDEMWLQGHDLPDDQWQRSLHMDVPRHRIQSDPIIEAYNLVIVGPTGPIQHRPILHDYSSLAGQLIPGVYDHHQGIIDIVGDSLAKPSDVKMFKISNRGDFVNFGDLQPNIAFKVETMQRLLDHVCQTLPTGVDGSDAPTRRILRSAGKEGGSAFGDSLRQEVIGAPRVAELSVAKLIDRWCRFDSSTGWGRFSLLEGGNGDDVLKISDNQLTYCTIEAEFNSFGRRDLQEPDPDLPPTDLCPFLSGYIEGVLSEMFGLVLQVYHPTETCMYHHNDRSSCRFLVTANAHTEHPEVLRNKTELTNRRKEETEDL